MGAIRDHWDSLNQTRGTVEVPEWNMTLYVGPITMGQLERIKVAEEKGDSNIEIILTLAKDDKGFPALQGNDVEDLKKFGTADVVPRVATDLVQAAPKPDAKKND